MCGNLSNDFGKKHVEKLPNSTISITCDIKEMALEFCECQVNRKKRVSSKW